MGNKESYEEFCKKEDIAIYSQYWYLNAVAGSKWDVVLYEKNGEVWGSLPYIIKKKAIFSMISQPKLTQYLGPYIKYPKDMKYHNRLSWEKEVIDGLIEQLPKYHFFKQSFSHSITNWLPFYWRGFSQTTKYTYIIDKIEDLDKFWEESLRKNSRKAVKKARKIVDVIESDDASLFYEMVLKSFKRQNLTPSYSKEFFLNLDRACKENGARKLFFAIDKESKKLHVALYLVYDKNRIYTLASGADPELRNSGAETLLDWEAIKFAHDSGKVLDYEGSMIEPIEYHARSMGYKQLPYFTITKSNSKILKTLSCLIGKEL